MATYWCTTNMGTASQWVADARAGTERTDSGREDNKISIEGGPAAAARTYAQGGIGEILVLQHRRECFHVFVWHPANRTLHRVTLSARVTLNFDSNDVVELTQSRDRAIGDPNG